jgi:hypothetical protein
MEQSLTRANPISFSVNRTIDKYGESIDADKNKKSCFYEVSID